MSKKNTKKSKIYLCLSVDDIKIHIFLNENKTSILKLIKNQTNFWIVNDHANITAIYIAINQEGLERKEKSRKQKFREIETREKGRERENCERDPSNIILDRQNGAFIAQFDQHCPRGYYYPKNGRLWKGGEGRGLSGKVP